MRMHGGTANGCHGDTGTPQDAPQGAQERAARFGRARTRPNGGNATAGGCGAFGANPSADYPNGGTVAEPVGAVAPSP